MVASAGAVVSDPGGNVTAMNETPEVRPTGPGIEPVLDACQRAVIDLPTQASAMVVGAPGTGKTATLVARVRDLVHRGVAPDDILVLTASRQTAAALRDRLGVAVGRATSGPMAHSIAAFAFRLVRAAAVHAGDEPPRLLTGGDEDAMVRDLLAGDAADESLGMHRWPDWLTADIRATRGFRSEVRAFLAECTTLGVGPRRLKMVSASADVPVWRAMASFFQDYLRVRGDMRGAHRDVAGLVREAAAILDGGDAAARAVFGHTRVVLVDDAQELTHGGVELVEACRRAGAAVLAFGDPDVSAGAFRGALPETFARLAAGLGTSCILATPHRGGAALVDLVRRVTSHIGAAGGVAHRRPPAGATVGDAVQVLLPGSPAQEADVIARILRERHVHDGVGWADCAVIAHDTRQVTRLQHELTVRDVPARLFGAEPALGSQAIVQDILRVVDLAGLDDAEWTADDVTAVLCGAAGGLDAVQLRRVRAALRRGEADGGGTRRASELLVSALRHPVEFETAGVPDARVAARVAEAVARTRVALRRGDTAHQVLWEVWAGTGLRERCERAAGGGPRAAQSVRDLEAVVALFRSAKRFDERDEASRSDVPQFVRGIRDSDVAQDRLEARIGGETVSVLTPAAALGREFDTVVIAGVQDGVWPNTRLRGGMLQTWRLADATGRTADETSAVRDADRRRDALHDELRLFVRAASRARCRLVVTAVDDDDTGPSVLFDLLPDPSRPDALTGHPLSLRGLSARYRRTMTEQGSTAAQRAHAAGQLALLAAEAVPGADPAEWYGVNPSSSEGPLRDLQTEDVRVSPSRLATLETCGLDWVIGDLGGDSGGTAAGLGTIIHAALEHADGADEQALWELVDTRWGELDFDAAWLERAERARARDLVHRLHAYLRAFAASGGRLLQAEPHFEVPVSLDDGGGHHAVVSGYIDRVEVNASGSVVIVDLKTGGNEPTTDAAVVQNPQLAAYQLAFESDAIDGTAGHTPGGAKLLVLQPSGKRRLYAEPWQPPFDDDSRRQFLERVRHAARAMAGVTFTAPFETHCRDDHAHGLCRIHTVGAVSAP